MGIGVLVWILELGKRGLFKKLGVLLSFHSGLCLRKLQVLQEDQ